MRVCFAVSTCIEYAPRTLVPCLDSLLAAGVDKRDILVFGLDQRYPRMDELQAAVYLTDHSYGFDWHFLLPCTSIAGPKFPGVVQKMGEIVTNENYDLMGFRPDIMVGHLGLFSLSFLRENRDRLLEYATWDQREKVQREIAGWIVKMAKHYGHFSAPEAPWVWDREMYGTKKVERHFPALDLLKYTRPYRTINDIPAGKMERAI